MSEETREAWKTIRALMEAKTPSVEHKVFIARIMAAQCLLGEPKPPKDVLNELLTGLGYTALEYQ